MNPTFEQAKRYGFIFPGARMWATPENRARIAQDAALITTPNTTVPAELAILDPELVVTVPAAITAGATGTGGSTKWADKTTVQIYNDVLALFAQLSEQSSGLIDKDTPLKFCLSPELAVRLGAATDFNVSVLDMLKRYFTRIDIVTVPELHSMTAGETMFLIAPEVNGQRTGTLAFGEKMRAGRVVPDLSSFRQKFVGTTYGGIVLMPFAFAQMTGA